MVIFAGPQVAGAIRNQFNRVTETLDDGSVGENFYEPEDIPDPESGTAFAVYSADDQSLMFYKRRGVPQVGDMFNDRRVTAVYTDFEETTPPSSGDKRYESGAWHEYKGVVKIISVIDYGIKPKDVSCWFGNFSALESFDIKKLDMTDCKSAKYLFVFCRKLTTADLSGWDTPVLKGIGGMFEQCWGLSRVDLKNWYAPKVTRCWYAFYGTSLKTIDLSKTTFGDITDSPSMFANNGSLESIDFGTGVYFSSTTDLSSMFKDCRRLQLDCSNWNVRSDVNRNAFNENAPGVILPKAWQ